VSFWKEKTVAAKEKKWIQAHYKVVIVVGEYMILDVGWQLEKKRATSMYWNDYVHALDDAGEWAGAFF